ncbi:MAG: pallilysin-related adhesin [Spirochaetaceae bacterium]|jgi:hypothetical protein|nr:pallilysin-related adhesin [Spirochaetaceae bacterium]
MKKAARPVIILVFFLTFSLIAVLVYRPEIFFRAPKPAEQRQSRVVIPRFETAGQGEEKSEERELAAFEDSMNAKIALNAGELLVTVLTQDFNGDLVDEQIIAYRNLSEPENRIYLCYVVFDRQINGYRRIWDIPTVVTRPGTISLYTQDITGDRGVCLILTGMNSGEARTMTIFKQNPGNDEEIPFDKIAEIEIDGSIQIQETDRTQAYRMGLTTGKSFTIAAYGRDPESDNILDQIEVIYSYNPGTNRFEESRLTRIPGSQIEQRRVRELLSGGSREFENFISGLWYYVSPQGTLDTRQYIYFDPKNRELIFYSDEVQQVFTWQNSSATRYGIYISSQNISVTTLRRSVDIELESLNSIRVKIFEDVRLKIGVSDSWQGSYRKAEPRRGEDGRRPFSIIAADSSGEGEPGPLVSYLDAAYDGPIGKLVFLKSGEYELRSGNVSSRGNYAFFTLDNRIVLELRPGTITGVSRETYLVEPGSGESPAPWKALTLVRVRLSIQGFQEVHEAAIPLSLVTES